MKTSLDNFEDKVRLTKQNVNKNNIYSKYRDLVFYQSSINPELTLAMIVDKPEKPGYVLAETHGWHMSMPKYEPNDSKAITNYLRIYVDMRGRAYSDGKQDCNGYELFDVIDAIEYVKENYKKYIVNPEVVYFEGGSGGGGNAFEIVAKFPDYFAACTAMCGISDYYIWSKNDKVGEFKDEMDIWIGDINNKESYDSRSGIVGVTNLYTPMFIAHGTDDIRVPFYHSKNYVDKAIELGKGNLISFYPLQSAGGMDHWTNATEEQLDLMDKLSKENRTRNKSPIVLPRVGKLIVQGYIVTKYFSLFLENINQVQEIEYDMDKEEIYVGNKTISIKGNNKIAL